MPNFNSLCNFKMDKELCKTCGKLIPKTNFARHLKSHSDEKKFSCYQCSKKFKTKDQLNCHLQTHRNPEDIHIQCQYCNHVLHSSSALTKYVKAKHEKVSYSCPYCQKSFSTSAYYQKHIETCNLSVLLLLLHVSVQYATSHSRTVVLLILIKELTIEHNVMYVKCIIHLGSPC